MNREITLQPQARIRHSTPPFTSYRRFLIWSHFPGLHLGRRAEELCSRTSTPPLEVLWSAAPYHASLPSQSCSPSSGNLSVLKTGSCFPSYCLHFLYTLATPQALKPQTLAAQSSPLCLNPSLPRNSGQKGIRPEEEEEIGGEGKQDMQGENITSISISKLRSHPTYEGHRGCRTVTPTEFQALLPQPLSPANLPPRTLGIFPQE